jgi:hypothetical protein
MNTTKAMLMVAATFALYLTMLVLLSNWRHHHNTPILLDVPSDLRAGK